MSDLPPGDPELPELGADGDAGAPQIRITRQYLKDLSFENPSAPESLAGDREPPRIDVSYAVRVNGLNETQYEVELQTTVNADRTDQKVFIVEVVFGAIFTLVNVPKELLQPVLLIECPRLLFPYARRIIADATGDGGYMPLMLDPIDFAAMYHQQQQQAAGSGNGAGGAGGATADPD